MQRTDILELMSTLKLYGMRAAYDEVMTTGIKRRQEPPLIVGDLLYDNILYQIVLGLSDAMRYPMPNYPCEFEIPDAWLAEAGMDGFTRTTPAYRSTAAAVPVSLREIEPPYRTPEKDWRGFDRGRLISLLNGIATGAEIEPVPLLKLPPGDFPSAPYGYRVRNGFHRFYASIAAGFECLPAEIS